MFCSNIFILFIGNLKFMNNYKAALGLKLALGYIYKTDTNPADFFSLLFFIYFLLLFKPFNFGNRFEKIKILI